MIINFKDKKPCISQGCFIAQNAQVIGDLTLDADSSIWFGAVVRADVNKIFIGKGTNIQDNSTIHVYRSGPAVKIGNNVTIGHNVTLHGCKIHDNCLIGMGSIILDGAEIGENTIIGAGSLVTQNKIIPSGVLCMGSPAKVIRNLTESEIADNIENAIHYIQLSKEYK
ncbi:MAG: isoleucine patch superfamily enzyme carbonic anhydrase/acetyltransferase [Clostridiaceae bacterium]|jgi:carbonic anhydrase/acetyltransferase-like protein (isoleucine patch superfamily)|nr:isoleucine patch superfamily enzyme carbonic anhydrase/acetyltransferase [Clostridiaceae bacterium]